MTEAAPNLPFRLHLGAAYYPEHWPAERWAEDIRLMKEANLTVARMGEFAWSTLEPSEGVFEFDWLDRVISQMAELEISVVLGTPTAAPPAWLTQAYPEAFAIEESGLPAQHGNRCHYCVNSTAYHGAVRRIVSAMAQRFGPNPNVIGWQIDNEFSRVCYCNHCRELFQTFLAERYGSIDVLNQRWSTAYWSQTYNSWDQIPLPIGSHNPGLMLEFKRFITHSYRRFQKIQIDELRPYLSNDVWITHNFMGWFDGFDHYELAEDLDMVSWDYYVGTGHHDYLNHSAVHSLTRGFKKKNFWVMETQPGNVNWSGVNNMLNQGEGRAMAWQSVAHGADGVLYWQWRSALGGQEQYHGTLVDQSGQPRLFYSEVKNLGAEFKKVSELLADSAPKARVAMLYDYESRWAIQWQKHHKDFDYVTHFLHYYRAFALRNLAVDIIPAKSLTDWNQLKGYRILIVPAINIMTERQAKAIEEYVRHSNHLVITLRTGVKDEYNALQPMRPPAYLSSVAGMEVEEYFALDEPAPIKGNFFVGQAEIWAERLKLSGQYALSMGKYKETNGWLDGKPAASVTGVMGGSGLAYYVGAYLDQNSQQEMIDRIIKNVQLHPINTPPNIEVRTRVKPNGKEIFIAINHSRQAETIWLPWLAREHLEDRLIDSELKLGAYGIAVLTQEEES